MAERSRQANEPLVEAIAKAFRWQEWLESGRYAGQTELAEVVGLDRKYVARILGLTSLAPDIVQAILGGNEPSGLSLTKLCKGVPMRWEEQRRKWSHQ